MAGGGKNPTLLTKLAKLPSLSPLIGTTECHFTLYLSVICQKQVRFHSENEGIIEKRNRLWVIYTSMTYCPLKC